MVWILLPVLALAAAAPPAQRMQAGRWDVISKVVEFDVPGVPGFIARMVRGKSKAEHKQLSAGGGVSALLAPDPKARYRIESERIAEGRYAQTLSCPQKNGTSLQISRSGTYDALGFAGRAVVAGTTKKGALRILLDQHATRVGS